MQIKEGLLKKDAQTKKIYTVSELNRQVRGLLESRFSGVWVEGEISNFKRHTSGHIYLTLKDKNAQVSAVFFSYHHRALKFELKDGLKVLAFGRVSVYEQRGQYQFYIERVEPQGVGALQLALRQLREKLEKEGLFRPERKRIIPKFPKTVGVVTSPTGAVIQDILNVVSRRFCGTNILLYPVRVQGEGSREEIAEAIEAMNRLDEVEVLIVGRGGGSLEDLWAFNEENVARAVYESRIPVISAVGHETDWTICDLVADLRAPTPSAAAELVVSSRIELEQRIEDRAGRLRDAMTNISERFQEQLTDFAGSAAFKQPGYLLDQFTEQVNELMRRLQGSTKVLLALRSQIFQNVIGRLNALNPLGILERGYSVSFSPSGAVLKNAGDVTAGEEITTRLHKGKLISKVIKVTQ